MLGNFSNYNEIELKIKDLFGQSSLTSLSKTYYLFETYSFRLNNIM